MKELTISAPREDELVRAFAAQLDEWDLWQSNPTEAFERGAEQFYRETGLIAPGKSVPLEMASTQDEDERRQRYNEWGKALRVVRHKMLRNVLAALSASRTPTTPTAEEG